jgi:succinate-semialdehyde dehydrogenase/glutarate-semialdehyde dehydrogenase
MAQQFLADEPLDVQEGKAWIKYQPLGVVLAVMPWNFPFWQVFRFAAPALMAGNTCLLKHASNVPRCALDIEEVFRNAGFPEYTFTTLLIGSNEVAGVIEDERVAAVTLTGSESAGSSVAASAGKNIKKSVLELGGSDPFIVLADADITTAASVAVKARMINCGQSCIAAKRFIVERQVAEEFVKLFIDGLQKLRRGNPMDSQTDYSTLARADLAGEVYQQVKKSIALGARALYGELPGKIEGCWFPPMILTDLKPGMPAHDEEVFGPVACFYIVENAKEAIAVANYSRYGLGASVWTKSHEKAMLLSGALECGAVYMNQMMFSDPAVPFGGIKKSGYGRELSAVGIREFTNQKSVWVK